MLPAPLNFQAPFTHPTNQEMVQGSSNKPKCYLIYYEDQEICFTTQPQIGHFKQLNWILVRKSKMLKNISNYYFLHFQKLIS